MPKQILGPLRSLHGRLYEKRVVMKKRRRQKDELKQIPPNAVFLMGTPTHPNIGDSAIAIAERSFLKKILPHDRPLVEITEEMFRRYETLAEQGIRKSGDGPIFLHGGGNMGDLWIGQELLRRKILAAFPDRRVIVFPQTAYYSDSEFGKAEERASVPFYNDRAGLTLTAREKKSFEIIRSLYPRTQTLLMPDIVLSSCAEDYAVRPQTRRGVLMCLRSDGEKCVQDSLWDRLKEKITCLGQEYRVTDMGADRMIEKEIRDEIVGAKMQEFGGAELVITDRLHGMVFAALTGTPCIVFSNYNHKVKGTYDWISYLPYIRFAQTAEEAERAIPELLAMKGCRFDNTPLTPYYDTLREIAEEACR